MAVFQQKDGLYGDIQPIVLFLANMFYARSTQSSG